MFVFFNFRLTFRILSRSPITKKTIELFGRISRLHVHLEKTPRFIPLSTVQSHIPSLSAQVHYSCVELGKLPGSVGTNVIVTYRLNCILKTLKIWFNYRNCHFKSSPSDIDLLFIKYNVTSVFMSFIKEQLNVNQTPSPMAVI